MSNTKLAAVKLATMLLCLTLPLQTALAADLAADRPVAAAPDTNLLNNDLPIPDSAFDQSLKPVLIRLKGGVTVTQKDTPAEPTAVAAPPAEPATAAAPPPVAPPSTTIMVPVATNPADPFTGELEQLIQAAEGQDPEIQKYTEAIQKHAKWTYRLAERSKDMLNYSCLFKGVSPSSEAGDVILEEKSKLKSLAAAKYGRQKLADALQIHILSDVLQLAMGLGNADASEGASQATEAETDLRTLAGKEETDKIVAKLKELVPSGSAQANVGKLRWSIAEARKRQESAVASAAKVDPIVSDIEKDVHHYNQHSTSSMAAHRVARVALSAASMTPNLIGPAAQVVLFSYITVTGGTEQDKLLNELYVDKRLSSRVNLLNEQAHLALYNYQLGAVTQNGLLMKCAERLLGRMAGNDTATRLLQSTAITSTM